VLHFTILASAMGHSSIGQKGLCAEAWRAREIGFSFATSD